MQKWIAITVSLVGIALISIGKGMDSTASFEGGTFIGEVGAIISGIICLGAGTVWLVALWALGEL